MTACLKPDGTVNTLPSSRCRKMSLKIKHAKVKLGGYKTLKLNGMQSDMSLNVEAFG